MLFHGHSELICGFNTFLPPGYRIEVGSDPREDIIMVTTPMGIITQPTDGSVGRLVPSATSNQPLLSLANGNATHNLQNLVLNASSLRPITPNAGTPGTAFARVQQPQPIPGYHGMPPPGSFSPTGIRVGTQTPNGAAVSILGNLSGRNPTESSKASGGQTGEFNHAIQYLNKIKLRYADDQNTYKSFLEILQTYQKEQRHLHDVSLTRLLQDLSYQFMQSQVYVQVQMLFKDAPDLLDEFKDFLPEILGGSVPTPAGLVGIPSQPSGPWNHEVPQERSSKGGSRRRKRGADKEAPQKAAPARVR
jgi:paired amphipathic helix protein Sin3a